MLKVLGKTFYTLFVIGAFMLALLFLGSHVSLLGYEVKVVQSGSMEPAVSTGSVVIIAPQKSYKTGDIVTFGKDTRRDVPVTHRIVEAVPGGFVTKGDANENIDSGVTKPSDIIGKVTLTIPFLGYAVAFARTKLGYLLLVGLPAILIILDEFADIVWEVRKGRARRRHRLERGHNKQYS